jgi:transcriptional regulator with XRE-family HTH domain
LTRTASAAIVGAMVSELARFPDSPVCAAPPDAERVLTIAAFVQRMRSLQPPPAYRLSLDSGVEYKNVRRVLEQPHAARLQTWQKLLHSLRIRMLAAHCAAAALHCAGWVSEGPPGSAAEAPRCAEVLREHRRARHWSRRELARRAGVSVDAIICIENGGGLVGTMAQLSSALDLRLYLVLPPQHPTLECLWRERAVHCLQEPEQYATAWYRAGRADAASAGQAIHDDEHSSLTRFPAGHEKIEDSPRLECPCRCLPRRLHCPHCCSSWSNR